MIFSGHPLCNCIILTALLSSSMVTARNHCNCWGILRCDDLLKGKLACGWCSHCYYSCCSYCASRMSAYDRCWICCSSENLPCCLRAERRTNTLHASSKSRHAGSHARASTVWIYGNANERNFSEENERSLRFAGRWIFVVVWSTIVMLLAIVVCELTKGHRKATQNLAVTVGEIEAFVR